MKTEPDTKSRRTVIKLLAAMGITYAGGVSTATAADENSDKKNVASQLPSWAAQVENRLNRLKENNGGVVDKRFIVDDTTDLRQKVTVKFRFANNTISNFNMEIEDDLKITITDDQGTAYSGRIEEQFNRQTVETLDNVNTLVGGN